MVDTKVPVLYTFPLSYNGPRVQLFLEEKGFIYKYKLLNILLGQNLTPDYLKINANGTVPTLQIDDTHIITESEEILRYVDSQGGPLGGDKVDRAIVDFWYEKVRSWDASVFTFPNESTGKMFNDFRIKVAEAQMKKCPELTEVLQKRLDYFHSYKNRMVDTAEREQVGLKLKELLKAAESNLSTTSFVAGEVYSIADAMVTILLIRAEKNGMKESITSSPTLSKYFDAMKSRHSYKKVIAPYNGWGSLLFVLPTLVTIFFRNLTHTY